MQMTVDTYCPRKIIGGVRFRLGKKVPLCREGFHFTLPVAEGSDNMASFSSKFTICD